MTEAQDEADSPVAGSPSAGYSPMGEIFRQDLGATRSREEGLLSAGRLAPEKEEERDQNWS